MKHPALRKHPLYFDDLFCNLVEAGETIAAIINHADERDVDEIEVTLKEAVS